MVSLSNHEPAAKARAWRRFLRRKPRTLAFEMTLPYLDHRAFTSGGGTLPLNQPAFQPSASKA